MLKSQANLGDQTEPVLARKPAHNFNYMQGLLDLGENDDFIDSDTNEYATNGDLHDFSGVFGDDADLLSALVYTNASAKCNQSSVPVDDYDQELQELLKPSKFVAKHGNLERHEPTFKDKFVKASKLKLDHEKLKSQKSQRTQSWVFK